MISKVLLQTRSSWSKLLRPQTQRCMSGYHSTVKPPHMNDVPFPEKFNEAFKRRQVGNNAVLIFGLAFFSFSFYFVANSGALVPNLTPPKKNFEM